MRKEVGSDNRLKFYKAMTIPVLMYRYERWVMIVKDWK
jgi:hypothetical protein